MDISLNAHVECVDGPIGKVENIIVNPMRERITYLVVRENDVANTQRLIPEKMIENASSKKITLSIKKDKFKQAPNFLREVFIPSSLLLYMSDKPAGDLPVTPASVRTIEEAVPQGGKTIHHGAKVYASDGRHIGKVDEFLMEKKTGRITHLVLKEGHLWGKKEISVPISKIQKYEDGNIHLNMDKQAVNAAPNHHFK